MSVSMEEKLVLGKAAGTGRAGRMELGTSALEDQMLCPVVELLVDASSIADVDPTISTSVSLMGELCVSVDSFELIQLSRSGGMRCSRLGD